MSPEPLAIVTGAAGGLGRAISRRLAADGHDLLLVDRDERVRQTATELENLGFRATAAQADIVSAGAGQSIAEAVEKLGASLSVLVNNAGITRDARMQKLTPQDFAAVIDVNLVAGIRLVTALRPMFASGAAVVNLASRSGFGSFGQANYAASKAGLIGATRAMALSWAPDLRVNAVAPGLIDTPMTRAMPDEVRERMVSHIPMQRIGKPEDVAGVVSFLAGPDAGYVTGQVLVCCGGRSIAG